MEPVDISTSRADEVAAALMAGRASLMERTAASEATIVGGGSLAGAVMAAGQASARLVDLTAEATTVAAFAITNARLDATGADG